MEEQWIVDRCNLRAVWLEHPDWSKQKLADAMGRSKSWVKKWMKRIRSSPLEDREVLQGLSRARKQKPPELAELLVERILAVRDHPPAPLDAHPVPSPSCITCSGMRSWRRKGFRCLAPPAQSGKCSAVIISIAEPASYEHEPEERPEPGVEWGMDFQGVSSVPADPLGKQKHVVEILNIVDHGSSAVVASAPGDQYTAETALRTVAEILVDKGCPDRIRLDRDPRWVGLRVFQAVFSALAFIRFRAVSSPHAANAHRWATPLRKV